MIAGYPKRLRTMMTLNACGAVRAPTSLRRTLTFWPLVFYGMGVIVGAGIYVAIGAVIDRRATPLPFRFFLRARQPRVPGSATQAWQVDFPRRLGPSPMFGMGSAPIGSPCSPAWRLPSQLSSLRHPLFAEPCIISPFFCRSPEPALIALLVGGFTAVAIEGVSASVGLAAALAVLEIAGLIAAMVAGFVMAPRYDFQGMLPADLAAWRATIAGAFIAFFAFIGFENLANLAEEVKDPRRTVPRGILGAIAASIALYLLVTIAAVLADSHGSNPLLGLFSGRSAAVFATVGGIAVANGVLVEIVMLARLFYGMARGGQLPAMLGAAHPHTQTPVAATILAGAIVLLTALLVPFASPFLPSSI